LIKVYIIREAQVVFGFLGVGNRANVTLDWRSEVKIISLESLECRLLVHPGSLTLSRKLLLELTVAAYRSWLRECI
jgi:hypothetical protein